MKTLGDDAGRDGSASDILAFVRTHSLAVQASVSMLGTPQAAVVGFIATDDFEMFFDTADSTRKVQNSSQLSLRPRYRWHDER